MLPGPVAAPGRRGRRADRPRGRCCADKARAAGSTASCPDCGQWSERVHSRYMRSLADAAVGGQPVRIQLQVRRFACARTACARKTFVEQVDDLTVRYGRRSQLLHRLLEAIGLALGGCAGAAGRPVVRAGESDDVATHGPGASRACAGRGHRGGGGRFRVTPRARVQGSRHR